MLRETHQDLVVSSSDFRVEKSAWERPLWIVVLHLNTTTEKEEKWVTSLQNQKFESQMKIESETRSSQPVNDAGSKNY